MLALLTRGLHLDGLADTADGLGTGRDPARALAAMKDPHVGAFGVVTLVLALLVQAAALSGQLGYGHRHRIVLMLVLAAAIGRGQPCRGPAGGVGRHVRTGWAQPWPDRWTRSRHSER